MNAAFAGRRGSHLTMRTASYRFWYREVSELYGDGSNLPTLDVQQYGLWIDLSPKVKGDIDNRVKLLSDVIKRPTAGSPSGLGIITDDKSMRSLHVELCEGIAPDRCRITVVNRMMWRKYVMLRMDE